MGLGFRVFLGDLSFWAWSLGFRVLGFLGFGFGALVFRVWGLRVLGSGVKGTASYNKHTYSPVAPFCFFFLGGPLIRIEY